jgi:hypothetical protein
MAMAATTSPSPEEVLPLWLDELQASDRAKGTIRRYKSAVEGFLSWYAREEQRPLTFATLTPIVLTTVYTRAGVELTDPQEGCKLRDSKITSSGEQPCLGVRQ